MSYITDAHLSEMKEMLRDAATKLSTVARALDNMRVRPDPDVTARVTHQMTTNGHTLYLTENKQAGEHLAILNNTEEAARHYPIEDRLTPASDSVDGPVIGTIIEMMCDNNMVVDTDSDTLDSANVYVYLTKQDEQANEVDQSNPHPSEELEEEKIPYLRLLRVVDATDEHFARINANGRVDILSMSEIRRLFTDGTDVEAMDLVQAAYLMAEECNGETVHLGLNHDNVVKVGEAPQLDPHMQEAYNTIDEIADSIRDTWSKLQNGEAEK